MKNNKENIIDRIKNIIAEKIGLEIDKDSISDEGGLATAVGVDSIGFLELRYQCEEEFGIKVEDDDFTPDNFYSCEKLCKFVEKKLGI